MTTFNTVSPRQRVTHSAYRGSYTQHLTMKQFETIMQMTNELNIGLEDLWQTWFKDNYEVGNWRSISINAASEIISGLVSIQMTERALMRKARRSEKEQHDYEMGWGF